MDRTLEDTFYILFTTRAFATGVPTTLAGTPVVSAYEDAGLTQITAGITLGVDHDGVTGLNLLTIVATAANGYGSGQDYGLVITTGTVGGVSVVGEAVGSFSLSLSAAFKRLGTPAGVSVSADIAAIQLNTLPLGYLGPEGYGIYIDDAAANTNTVNGTDGIFSNPVSTLTAARTLADSLGIEIYYILNNSSLTLAATHVDWEFVGFGSMADNTVNLGSQDVSRSRFVNMTVEGDQGGSGRVECDKCALQDPGAGTTTLHIFALGCGIVDDITIDTSNDNIFEGCYSLVAGTASPIIRASGAAGTMIFRGQMGGVDLRSLSASHNVTLEQVGQVIFDASNNVNANVVIRGIGSVTDNTAGMSSLTQDAYINMSKINTECDTAISDAALATSAAQTTAQNNLDIITGASGVNLLTATQASIDAIESDTNELQTDDIPGLIGSPSGASVSADIAAVKADTAAIVIDTNELQGDWTNGGRLDLILDAILDDTGTSGVVLTVAERTSIADAILDRDMATGTDSGSTTVRTIRQALRSGRNKVTISGGTMTVYKENDTTASWTAAVTTTAGDPISDIDPA